MFWSALALSSLISLIVVIIMIYRAERRLRDLERRLTALEDHERRFSWGRTITPKP
jgi:hypothetical protein